MQYNSFFQSFMPADLTVVFIGRLPFFVKVHVYHHLVFDKFAQFVANMKKFWA